MKLLLTLVFFAIVGTAIAFLLVPRLTPDITAEDKPQPGEVPESSGGLLNPEPFISILEPQGKQLVQGRSYQVRWSSKGIDRVRVVAVGDKTGYRVKGRGQVREVIAESVPSNQTTANWKVPFLDTINFDIIAKGLGSDGKVKAMSQRSYKFRPDVLAKRTADGIYIDLRADDRQRLYVLKNNEVIKAYLTSGASSSALYPPNIHPKTTHDHPGVFKVENKYPLWHSRDFDVDMLWAMRYLNGHFIHATSPNLYSRLGHAASHGCNRLTRRQAKELYDMTPIGTRVEIIAR